MEDKSRTVIRETDANQCFCPIKNMRCAGSFCMMWKWVLQVPVGEVEYKLQGPHCPSMKTQRSEYGFCGMVK